MVLHHLQSSFAGGEISPSLLARVDSVAYNTWLKKARNFFVHPQGGASNRPGTLYMGTAKKTKCRLVPFVPGENEAYVLEMGEKYLRVFTSAGQVLDSNSQAYELETPYTLDEVRALQYTQYDQTLFLTQSNHPPMRLVRQDTGVFSLEEVPVAYGPFCAANQNAEHRVRVVQSQQEVETDGVRATLSVLPLIDNRYIVYAFFNGNRFFVGHGYGLDVSALANQFNETYGSQGLTAYNLGGLLKIESPQATGGDWNGATLVLEYHENFLRPSDLTVSQTLTGGANAGTIEEGETQYILESDFDLFLPSHEGGLFSLTHGVESQYENGTLGYESTSSSILTSSDWTLHTTGVWTGTLVVEKSGDMGESWQIVNHFTREEGDENLSVFGELEDLGGLYYVRVRSLQITGEAVYNLSSKAFVQEGIVKIDQFINARKAAVTIKRPYSSSEWTSDWAEGSFSDKNGYPSCVFFYQDRLGLAGTHTEAQTLWFSKTGDYSNFGHSRSTLADDDSISINLSGKKLNAIRSVAVAGKLLVFTAGSEWSISCDGALTPYNISVQEQGERGAGAAAPVMIGHRALFVQARGGVLRDFYYDYTATAYTGTDLTLCAKHLFFNQEIQEICYQQEPDNLVWCVLSNGILATLTYMAEQGVCAWTHQDTQGYFRSVCTIPCRGYDEVWLAVERDGQYLIEKLSRRLVSDEPADQVFLDACVSAKSDTAFTEVTGLNHLEGKSVQILADGNTLPQQKVQNGKITLPRAMNCVQVGLKYSAELHFLPVAYEQSNGTAVDRKRRVVSVTVKMLDSRGGKVGLSGEPKEEILQRTTEPFNTPIGLKTSDYVIALSGMHALAPVLELEQSDPLPLTVLGLVAKVS